MIALISTSLAPSLYWKQITSLLYLSYQQRILRIYQFELIFRYLPASDRRLAQIQQHQEKDPILKRWREEVSGGGRKRKSNNYNDLSICNGLLLIGNSIVIPDDLRNEVLEQLHTGHQGLVKCKERARVSVWWPGITKDIEAYIRKCIICCQFQQTKYEPFISSELPPTHGKKLVQICLYGIMQPIYW